MWLSYDISSDKFFAIKIQTPGDYEEGIKELKIYEMIEKICKEDKTINSLMLLKESFIITKDEDKYVCMVMELMGGSVYDIIKTDKYNTGLGEDITLQIQIQLMEAINILHKNDIIHTDVKPENILVCGMNF